jgi:serpin B
VNYGAGVFLTDFAGDADGSRRAINAAVSKDTQMSIPELLPSGAIDSYTRFVLTDAVYLNARWDTPFNVAFTRDEPFTKLDGSSVTAAMMHAALRCAYAAGQGYQAIELPYAEERLDLVAVLPDAGNYEALDAALNPTWFDALRASLTEDVVNVGLPKLDLSQHVSMKNALEALGMTTAFALGSADFSGMTSEDVAIANVFHQATLKLVEAGTIATAATGIVIATHVGAPQPRRDMSFDRPFLFAISDPSTGELLFVGRVLDPTAQ